MCGIIGYTGTESAISKLTDGLTALEYRGYDSAGVAFFAGQSLMCVKSQGRLSFLKEKLDSVKEALVTCCGIGHTRWATHGKPSDANSHPHGTENLYIVHNGIIENFAEIKSFLLDKGYTFESETDTETAAKLIDYFYMSGMAPTDAIRNATAKITGSYAIGAIFKSQPGKIFAFRKDSPLLVCPSDIGNFIGSDISAVLKYTKKFIRLEEGEIAVLSPDNIDVISKDGTLISKEYETATWDIEAAEKGGYPHFMIKEIHEEPDAILKTLRPRIKDGLPHFNIGELTDKNLDAFRTIHIVACGTAMHAGLIGKYAIEKLARVPVNVELASEFRYKNPVLSKDDLVIIISQSGETADTLAALRLAKAEGVYTLAIVNVAGSTIDREADGVLYTWAGPEIAVASTKAYSVQISLLYLFAIRLALAKGKLTSGRAMDYCEELLTKAPAAVTRAIDLKTICSDIADKYKHHHSIFFIGRGHDYQISCEAALKMKEISYIHCEAYAAGELKHGTISLITDGTPVFAFATSEELFEKTVSNIKEVKSRGAKVVLFIKESMEIPDDIADDIIRVPELSEIFMPITAITPTQLLAYYMSCHLGCDVDKPRNLAKSVTVE